jgi:hypothetical protein
MCAAADKARRAGLRGVPNIDIERFMSLDDDQLRTVLQGFIDSFVFIPHRIHRAIGDSGGTPTTNDLPLYLCSHF